MLSIFWVFLPILCLVFAAAACYVLAIELALIGKIRWFLLPMAVSIALGVTACKTTPIEVSIKTKVVSHDR